MRNIFMTFQQRSPGLSQQMSVVTLVTAPVTSLGVTVHSSDVATLYNPQLLGALSLNQAVASLRCWLLGNLAYLVGLVC